MKIPEGGVPKIGPIEKIPKKLPEKPKDESEIKDKVDLSDEALQELGRKTLEGLIE